MTKSPTMKTSDGQPATASGEPDDIESIRKFAVTYLRNEQDIDLQAFGVQTQREGLERADGGQVARLGREEAAQQGQALGVIQGGHRVVVAGHAPDQRGAPPLSMRVVRTPS